MKTAGLWLRRSLLISRWWEALSRRLGQGGEGRGGRTSLREFQGSSYGLSCLVERMATPLLHRPDHGVDVGKWSRREDAVPQSEDMAQTATGFLQNLDGGGPYPIGVGEKHCRIEISLEGPALPH